MGMGRSAAGPVGEIADHGLNFDHDVYIIHKFVTHAALALAVAATLFR